MEFWILGPLEVREGGRQVRLGPAKQRSLLGVLLLHGNEAVSSERLVDELWGERPPARAAKLVQGHVSSLRKLLGADRIVTQPPGYFLRVGDDEVDVRTFERLVAGAREEGPERAAELLREALSLWRGAALADLRLEGFAAREADRLDELRLAARLERIDADLSLGRHGELIGELEPLVAEHPLRERPRGQLMLALYRSGRQAEALALYRETRALLRDELGLDPGNELQQLERRMLAQDRELDLPRQAPPAAPSPAPLPTGTVTLVFTDVEGSTRLLPQLGIEAYAEALAEHRRALREAFVRHGGVEVDTQGDSFFVAFSTAAAALAAATEAHQVLAAGPIRVRIGIHTGTPHITEEGYVGPDVHRAARIAAAGHGGQILVSSSTASLIEGDSLRDLGEHRLKDLAAPERIYQLGVESFPPLMSMQRANLPILATPFLGRQRELDEVTALLASEDARLLTLTGPAGAGKTRLALQAAAEASGHYPGGVFWAPLVALRDSKLVLEVAAQALDARDGLADRIADRRLLLVLDNFEHLIDAAGELAGLLAACPNLQLLVTSRELLRIPGEQAYPVPPLEPRDATQLFIARARAADPRFEPGPMLEHLCSRLDNLPLALELAATRVAVLSPEQLSDRLGKRLDLLKAGRGVDPRQQTLRATLDWSYELLDEEERLLLERLSVFRGGCTLEAAEEICDADINTLQSLIDKSLLRRHGERFSMLETIREYAAEQLEQDDEADVLAERHAQYFLALAEEASPAAPDGELEKGHGLRHDLDNLRSALGQLIGAGDAERELRLATAAFWSLWTLASLRELKVWLVSALERAGGVDSRFRAEALGATALAAANLGERDDAREYARESLALARERDDQRQIEWALRVLSFDEPDLDERRRLLQECERLNRELGNDAGLGWVTYLLGWALFDEGRFEEARDTFEQAAAIFTDIGKRWEATNAEIQIAYALIADGECDPARPILEEALRTAVDLQSEGLAVEALIAVGSLRVQTEPSAAARLLSAAWAIGEEGGQTLDPRLRGLVAETAERQARERLGERFEREWEAGSDLTLEEAVALALDEE